MCEVKLSFSLTGMVGSGWNYFCVSHTGSHTTGFSLIVLIILPVKPLLSLLQLKKIPPNEPNTLRQTNLQTNCQEEN